MYVLREMISWTSLVCMPDSKNFLLQHVQHKQNSEIAYPVYLCTLLIAHPAYPALVDCLCAVGGFYGQHRGSGDSWNFTSDRHSTCILSSKRNLICGVH